MAQLPQWEYRLETFGSFLRGPNDEEMEAILNEWGEEGWEVISARSVENTSKVAILAKRPLTDSVKRRRSLPV